MVEMVTDPRHLRVDETRRSITASMIFKWYTGDFVAPNQVRVCERVSGRGFNLSLACAIVCCAL
jgi:hypothetical protein